MVGDPGYYPAWKRENPRMTTTFPEVSIAVEDGLETGLPAARAAEFSANGFGLRLSI